MLAFPQIFFSPGVYYLFVLINPPKYLLILFIHYLFIYFSLFLFIYLQENRMLFSFDSGRTYIWV